MWRCRDVAIPGEYGNGSDGPCSTKEFYDATNAELFLVAEGLEPPGELVGTLNVPRHRLIMP